MAENTLLIQQLRLELLDKKILTSDGQFLYKSLRKYPDLKGRLGSVAASFGKSSYQELVYCIVQDNFNLGKCEQCGKPTKFLNHSVGYREFCSIKCSANSSKVQNKIKETSSDKYGGHHTQNKEWQEQNSLLKIENMSYEKGMQTYSDRYGVENRFQLPEVKEKIKSTMIERYGVENPQQVEAFREAASSTCLKRYGRTSGFPSYYGNENPMRDSSIVFTSEVARFIESLGVRVERHDRTILGNGMELDIVCPDQKIAFEFNGIYWHAESQLAQRVSAPRNYHAKKTQDAAASGYQLFHIFENEWKHNQELVKSMISVRLGICSQKIYARKCKVVELSASESRKFLSENHIQGAMNSAIKLGLKTENDELVMIMTVGANRFSKGWELHRIAALRNTIVIGGAAKLLKEARVRISGPLVSFCNLQWGTGNVYAKLGFRLIENTSPGYFYIVDGQLQHRMKFQKHKLEKLLPNFDKEKSEYQNMLAHGYDRIWDCGHGKWILE